MPTRTVLPSLIGVFIVASTIGAALSKVFLVKSGSFWSKDGNEGCDDWETMGLTKASEVLTGSVLAIVQ